VFIYIIYIIHFLADFLSLLLKSLRSSMRNMISPKSLEYSLLLLYLLVGDLSRILGRKVQFLISSSSFFFYSDLIFSSTLLFHSWFRWHTSGLRLPFRDHIPYRFLAMDFGIAALLEIKGLDLFLCFAQINCNCTLPTLICLLNWS